MAQSQIRIEIPERRSPRGMARALREAQQEASRKMVLWWVKRALPRHFTSEGARVYGYSERGEKYRKFKARKYRHSRPLELTGALKAAMLGFPAEVRVSGRGATARFGNLPWYTKVYQKASLGMIQEALSGNEGDIKSAAAELGMSASALRRRVRNQKDMHEDVRMVQWRVTEEVLGKLRSKVEGLEVISEWEAKAALAREVFVQQGRDVRATANAMGVSMSTVGKWLRNPTYKGRASGQTANKERELLAVTAEEGAVMARVARSVIRARLGEAGLGVLGMEEVTSG